MAPGGAIILIALQMIGTVLEEFYYKEFLDLLHSLVYPSFFTLP